MTLLVSAKNLTIGYSKNYPVISGINLDIRTGDRIAVTGGNGSGKTTLIKTISGLLEKISGELFISKKKRVSMVPQIKNVRLHFPVTVKDAILMPEENFFWKNRKFSETEMVLLEKLGLNGLLKKQLKECSGGQIQKTLLARSVISRPSLIILDEPLDALDISSQKTVYSVLEDADIMKDTAVITITHNIYSENMSFYKKIYEASEGLLREK
ncbi:MAG TPA: ATP-binding cassette domain-containing protein [Leptospiraceae bacterium]|nr:ATP-binding cassette domain-containing protein [Leptospiraceae bacterium]